MVDYDADNAERLFNVLSRVGNIDPTAGRKKLVTPKIQVRWFDVELLTSIEGINFTDVWRRASHTSVDGFRVLVASAEDILAAKKVAGRPEDKEDIEFLEGIISGVLDH